MKKRFIAAVLAVVLVCSLAGVGTMAWFTSTAVSNNNEFKAGTLILGGIDGNEDTPHIFKNITFDAMEPGQPPQKVRTTVLKNVGTLPFYIYRLTASALVGDIELDGVLKVDVSIGGKNVYHGKLSELVETNGGFFNPMYDIQAQDTKDMVIEVYMDENTGNTYQGKSMKCDFTVYAAQDPSQMDGIPADTREYVAEANPSGRTIGNITDLDIYGKNTSTGTTFYYDWKYYDIIDEFRDYYDIKIKHHSGKPGLEIDIRTYILKKDTKEVRVNDTLRSGLSQYISYNDINDTVTIDKNLFTAIKPYLPEEYRDEVWDMVDVKFTGAIDSEGTYLFESDFEGWQFR